MSVAEHELQSIFKDDWSQTGSWRLNRYKEVAKLELPKIGKLNLKPYQFDNLYPIFEKRETVDVVPKEIKQFITDEDNVVIVYDGSIVYKQLTGDFRQVIIKSYFDALEDGDTKVFNALWQDVEGDSRDRLHAINRAYRNSGLYIEVPTGLVLRDTLKIHIVASRDLIHRSVIVARPHSEFQLLEIIDSVQPAHVNYTTETEVQENAHVHYLSIDRLGENSPAYIDRRANVYQDGHLIYALGQLNNSSTISNTLAKLKGRNAHCEARNVLMTDGENLHAVTVHIEHEAEYSVGNIINHGIVKDKGHLHLDGIGKIHKGQKQSNAQQSSSIITLSDRAKVVANPYLLIDEYDVMAGHGASIGQVDEEQLYYMMSRGMTRRDAEKLIIVGFLSPIIEMIDSDEIRKNFIETIERKLEQ